MRRKKFTRIEIHYRIFFFSTYESFYCVADCRTTGHHHNVQIKKKKKLFTVKETRKHCRKALNYAAKSILEKYVCVLESSQLRYRLHIRQAPQVLLYIFGLNGENAQHTIRLQWIEIIINLREFQLCGHSTTFFDTTLLSNLKITDDANWVDTGQHSNSHYSYSSGSNFSFQFEMRSVVKW